MAKNFVAKKLDINDDAPTLNGPIENAPKFILYIPPQSCSDSPACVYAPSSPDQCGTGTIGFFEINLILQILNKFLATVGEEEIPGKIRGIIGGFMTFCVIFNLVVYCCSFTKQKLVLPFFGTQIIRLAGILLFISCILYGYLKKDDILFTYKYNIDSSLGNIVPYIFWFFDILTAIWLIIVVYKCYAYLRNLNKNYPYSDVYEMF